MDGKFVVIEWRWGLDCSLEGGSCKIDKHVVAMGGQFVAIEWRWGLDCSLEGRPCKINELFFWTIRSAICGNWVTMGFGLQLGGRSTQSWWACVCQLVWPFVAIEWRWGLGWSLEGGPCEIYKHFFANQSGHLWQLSEWVLGCSLEEGLGEMMSLCLAIRSAICGHWMTMGSGLQPVGRAMSRVSQSVHLGFGNSDSWACCCDLCNEVGNLWQLSVDGGLDCSLWGGPWLRVGIAFSSPRSWWLKRSVTLLSGWKLWFFHEVMWMDWICKQSAIEWQEIRICVRILHAHHTGKYIYCTAMFHTILGNGMIQSHLIAGSMIPLSSCEYFVDWNMISECLVPFVRVAISNEFVLSKDSQLSGMV